MANPILSHPRFYDEAAAFEWVERTVWPAGPVCPHCGTTAEHVGKLQNQRSKASKKNPEGKLIHGLYKCYACRKAFTVRIGTIFEDSHAPMTLWMQAMYLLCSSKKGISANQLSRTLGVHLKTAWHMTHRIRLATTDKGSGPLGGADLFVEADETYIGGKEGNKHVGKRGKRGPQGKSAVVAWWNVRAASGPSMSPTLPRKP